MNPRDTILKNILHVMSGQSVALLLSFITHAYLARALGTVHYGILGFSVSVVSYFGILAALGTDAWGARSIARDDSDSSTITGQIVSVRLALSLASLLTLIILLSLWNQSALVNIVILVQALSLFIAAFTLDFAFQGLERLNIIARRQMIAAFVALLGILLFLQLYETVLTAAIVFQMAALLAAIYMIVVFRRTIASLSLKIDLAWWKVIIAAAAPFAVTGIINAIYFSIDVVIIGLLIGKADVGLYVAAGKVLALGLAISGIFRTVFFPILSRLVSKPGVRIEASEHHARSVVFIGGLVALGGFLLAPEILQILFGVDYLSAEAVLRILMVNLAVAYVVEVYHLQLVAWNHDKAQMYVMLYGALTNVILNLIFIPKYGIEAAAATTLISSLVVFGLSYLVLQRHQQERHHSIILRNWVLFFVFALVGYQFVTQFDLYNYSVVARFLILGSGITIIYCLTGWLIRAVTPIETFRYLNKDQEKST